MRLVLFLVTVLVGCGGGAAGDDDGQSDGDADSERPEEWLDFTCSEVLEEIHAITVEAAANDCRGLAIWQNPAPDSVCQIVTQGFPLNDDGTSRMEAECVSCRPDDAAMCSKVAAELRFRFDDCDCRRE